MSKVIERAIEKFLKESADHLLAYENIKSIRGFKPFPAKATQYVILTDMIRKFKPVYYQLNLPKMRSTSLINLIARELMAYYDHELGSVHNSHSQLATDLDLGSTAIETAITQLLKTGLWGRVQGIGTTRTIYFPLFTEKGMTEYLKLIEKAKLGIHPHKSVAKKQSKPESASTVPDNVIEAIIHQDERVQIDGVDGVVDANGEIHDIEQEPTSDTSEPIHDDIEPPLAYASHEHESNIPENEDIHELEPADEHTPPDSYEPETSHESSEYINRDGHTSGFSSGGLG